MNETETFARPSSASDVLVFLGGGGLVGGVVYAGVPVLTSASADPLVSWMLLSIPLVFIPIILSGFLLLRSEGVRQPWRERLRLYRPTGADWTWGLLGLVCIGVGGAALMNLSLDLGLDPNPPFSRDLPP
jgi:hypothetical protein